MAKKQYNKKRKNTIKPKGSMLMGNLPPGFTLKSASNFGTEEPFVARVWIQIKDILKYIDLPNDDETDFRLDGVVEQLDIARVHSARICSVKLPLSATPCLSPVVLRMYFV